MIEIMKYIKYKLIALWWFITRKNFYVISYNSRIGRVAESYNVVIPEFLEWFQKKHGFKTNEEIINELKEVASVSDDKLVRQMIIDLINDIKKGGEG